MTKRTFWNVVKYVLAFVLLAWVVLLNWDPHKHSWTSLFDIGRDTGDAIGLLVQGKGSEALDAWGRTIRESARYKLIAPEDIDELQKRGVPAETVEKLRALDGQGFETPEAFSAALAKVLSPDELDRYGARIEARAEMPGLAFVLKRHALMGAEVRWGYLGLAFVICLLATLLTFVRWYLLVRAVDLPFTVGNALRLGMVGYFYNTFLPGSVGGDIVKAAFLAREHSRRTVAVATVLMDRVLALWAFIGFVAIAGSIFWACGMLDGPGMQASLWMIWGTGAAVIISLICWLLLGLLPQWRVDKLAWRLENQVPKVGPSMAEFWRAVWMYRCRQKTVALTMLMTWVAEFGFILVFYFSVLTLWSPDYGPIPTFPQHLLLVPIGLVVMAVPLFPGGVGIGELGFGGLYAAMGCLASLAVLGSLVQRVVMWGLAMLGLLVYQRMKPALKAATQAPPSQVTPTTTPDAGLEAAKV